MASFKYEPIAEAADIRLVKLMPGIPQDPVHCELFDASFAEEPSYQALSYTWGKPSDGFKKIQIDGKLFQAGVNLYEALRAVRYESTDIRCLWVDSLCINQADNDERSSQVQRMGDIYSRAGEVLVWLGPAKDNSNLAIAAINRISLLPSADRQEEEKVKSNFRRHRAAWTAIGKLCGREYWQRMWIVQEVQLARRLQIHCGPKSTTWEALTDTLSLAQRTLKCKFKSTSTTILLDVTDSLASRLEAHRVKRLASGSTLIELLKDCRNSLCSDPKDKVYALVGIASDCKDREMVVDYSKALGQIYKDVLSLYSVDGWRHWDHNKLRSTVQFSAFLQDILRPPIAKQTLVPLELGHQDNEPVWVSGRILGSLGLEHSTVAERRVLTAKDLRKVIKPSEEAKVFLRSAPPHTDDFHWAPMISNTTSPTSPANLRLHSLNETTNYMICVPTESEKGDLVLRFSGHDTGLVVRWNKPDWILVGTAALQCKRVPVSSEFYWIETPVLGLQFDSEQDVYICLNFALLQRLTVR